MIRGGSIQPGLVDDLTENVDVFPSFLSHSGIQNEDIYRSMVIGAGIGGVSGAGFWGISKGSCGYAGLSFA